MVLTLKRGRNLSTVINHFNVNRVVQLTYDMDELFSIERELICIEPVGDFKQFVIDGFLKEISN